MGLGIAAGNLTYDLWMQRIQQNINLMENIKKSYRSQSYNPLKAFLYCFPIYVLITGVIIVVFRHLHMPAFGVTAWIIVSLVPFLFQIRVKELFTKNIELTFDNQIFIIQEYAIRSGSLLKETNISWAEIQSFKCSFSSGVTYITIRLRDRSNNNLSFKEGKTQEQILSEKSVFSIFYYYVRQYNRNQLPEDAIVLKPGFLTTKLGALLLYSLTGLAIASIIIHIKLAPRTFMLSFMSGFIIIGLVVKRKNDKDLYNRISQLEPRLSPSEPLPKN